MNQLCVLPSKVMPRELEVRGAESASAICDMLSREITASKALTETPHAGDSYEVFRRPSGAWSVPGLGFGSQRGSIFDLQLPICFMAWIASKISSPSMHPGPGKS